MIANFLLTDSIVCHLNNRLSPFPLSPPKNFSILILTCLENLLTLEKLINMNQTKGSQ